MFLLTLNKMRHTLLYNSMIRLVTVPRLGIRNLGSSASQNSLKPIPSNTRIGLMSLHMNEINVCVQASCRGCFAEVPHIMPYSLGCTFWRCSLKLLVVEWSANSSLQPT